MDRISLKAEDRQVLGKKVKNLRKNGLLPAHVFGKKIDTEHISVDTKEFMKVYISAGETSLIDLKLDKEKVKPVLIREVQYDPVNLKPLHVDFYQVNLSEKVKVSVPVVLMGEQPEKVHLGEAIVLQTISEIEVEALPTDLIEKIEVDISSLKEIDDAITVATLNYNHGKITVLVEPEEVVVKLAPAVSAEMEALLAEQEAEAAAAAEPVEAVEGEVVTGDREDKEVAEGETEEAEKVPTEAPAEEQKESQR